MTYEAVAPARRISSLSDASTPRLHVGARALVVCATCLAYVVPATIAALAASLVGRRDAGARLFARRLVALAQRLGPTFVKVGQIVGTRQDLVPPSLCEELETLAESVSPMSPHETAEAFVEAYGSDLGPFADVDWAPVASGSVACVLRATLSNGRTVAVKLRRPGIERAVTADLTLARALSRVIARLPALAGVPVRESVAYVCQAIEAQLDFVGEAASLARLRENLSAVPRVWVPSLEANETRENAIVMEFIPDLDVTAAAAASTAMRKRYATAALAAVYQMLFVDGLVHCDLHRGNLYFTKAGEVVILDAGFTVQLSERIRRLFAEFFFNMTVGNGERCAEAVIESANAVRSDADLDGFRRGIDDLVGRSCRTAARDFSLIAFARELLTLQREHGLQAESEIVFPLLSLLVIEGTIRDLHPDIDFQEEARPVLMKAIFEEKVSASTSVALACKGD